MGAINVGIGHNNNAIVAQLGDIKLFTKIGAQGDNQRFQFVVGQHFIDPGAFHV